MAEAHDHLDIQHSVFARCEQIGNDTSAAEAVFKTMGRTMETFEEDRLQIEAELVMAKAGPWFEHFRLDR